MAASDIVLSGAADGPIHVQITNSGTGLLAIAEVRCSNGPAAGDFGITGTAFNDGSDMRPGEVFVAAESTSEGLLFKVNAVKPIRFVLNHGDGKGTHEAARFEPSGDLVLTNHTTPTLIITRRSRGVWNVPAAVTDGDGLGGGEWHGYDGSAYVRAVGVYAEVDGAVSTGVVRGRYVIRTDGQERLRITARGSVVVGTSALAPSASDGFLYVPSCAGVPTGLPTTHGASVPLVYDTQSHRLYAFAGNAWRSAAFT